jgi:hypothetical protein
MSCERYRDALGDVAAGGPAAAGVEAHLGACEACRAELGTLRQALAMADAEMTGLLADRPSPEMVVRIRRAVADSGAAPAWRFGWLWPAVAVAATLAVALAVRPGRGSHPAPPVASSSRPETPAPAVPQAVAEPTPAAPAAPAVAALPAAAPRRGPVDTTPEVLVPPGEAEALLRFAAHVQTRVVSPDSLLVADLSAPLAEPEGVEIQPLEIVPLNPAETSGTD